MNLEEKAEQAKKLADEERLADLCHEAKNYFLSYENECKDAYWRQVASMLSEDKCIQYWYAKSIISSDGKRDLKRAVKLFTKSAKGGYAEAMSYLGYIYEAVMKKSKKAYFWYKAGADAGNVQCMREVAICYRDGYGVRASNSKAQYWFGRAGQEKK